MTIQLVQAGPSQTPLSKARRDATRATRKISQLEERLDALEDDLEARTKKLEASERQVLAASTAAFCWEQEFRSAESTLTHQAFRHHREREAFLTQISELQGAIEVQADHYESLLCRARAQVIAARGREERERERARILLEAARKGWWQRGQREALITKAVNLSDNVYG